MKLLNAIKDLFDEIRDPYPRVRGSCRMCGTCCRSVILTYLRKPVMSMKQFNKLLKWDWKTYERFVPDEMQEKDKPIAFTCKYVQGNRCTVHETRPMICRTYPHRSIFKIGAVLEKGCGYRIIEKGSFEDILSKKVRS